MNLKLRFTILVTSVISIPILVMGLLYLIYSNPHTQMDEIANRVRNITNKNQIAGLIEEFNDSYYFTIMGEGKTWHSSNYLSPREFPEKIFVQSAVIETLTDGEYLLSVGRTLAMENSHFPPLIFFSTLLTVLIGLSLSIIRSIERAIRKLEVATARIAQGDLTFHLGSAGKDSFGSLIRSLDIMREQIKAEQDRRNRFFMGVSHDLKTPLSSITGYTDALLEGLAPSKEMEQRYLEIINKKSHELERRITSLIHYIKLSREDFISDLKKYNLSLFLRDFLTVSQEEATFRGETLRWSLYLDKDLKVPFHRELLRRALENLINNGFQYGEKGEDVIVSVSKIGNSIEISIENRGEPIASSQLPYLFEPFYRGDPSRKGDGFGLGLASVKSISDNHGWALRVQGKDKRTYFIISIPL